MTAAASVTNEIAQLNVEIDDVTPRVARCVEVPFDIRLDDLHFVLQIAIGWQNGHPFEFRVGDRAWGPAPIAMPETAPTARGRGDARRYFGPCRPTFKYDYVLGEDWEHTVTLLARSSVQAGVRYPHLVRAPKAAARQPTSAVRSAMRLTCAASPILRASITTTCWISTLPTSIQMWSMKRRCAVIWRA